MLDKLICCLVVICLVVFIMAFTLLSVSQNSVLLLIWTFAASVFLTFATTFVFSKTKVVIEGEIN